MPRFASCVQNGASRTIFPAALFIVLGMADRSAARIPSRQALLQQAVVPVAQQEVVAAAEAPGAQQEVVAVAAVPVVQQEVVAVAAVPVVQQEVAAEEVAAEAVAAAVPVVQQEVAAVAVVPVAQQEEVVVVVATVPASQQEVVATEAAAPAAVLEPPVVLTQASVQALLPAPAIAGSVRCREMAAAVASAPPAMAMPRAVAAHCRSGLAMDLGRASSRPARSRLVSSG
jgi:hypothetical protein